MQWVLFFFSGQPETQRQAPRHAQILTLLASHLDKDWNSGSRLEEEPPLGESQPGLKGPKLELK